MVGGVLASYSLLAGVGDDTWPGCQAYTVDDAAQAMFHAADEGTHDQSSTVDDFQIGPSNYVVECGGCLGVHEDRRTTDRGQKRRINLGGEQAGEAPCVSGALEVGAEGEQLRIEVLGCHSDRELQRWTECDVLAAVCVKEIAGPFDRTPGVAAAFRPGAEQALVGEQTQSHSAGPRGEAPPPAEVAAQTQFVMVSFDTARDTPDKLRAYADEKGLDKTRWHWLVGSPLLTRQLATLLGVQYRDAGNGVFAHSNLITVLDPEGVPSARLEGLGVALDPALDAIRAAVD